MTSSVPEPATPRPVAAQPTAQVKKANWQRRAILVVTAIVVLVLLILFMRAFLPRWWAQRIGHRVQGSFSGGVLWGLFYGAVFTFVPLIVARQAFRKRFRMPYKIAIIVLAVLLAIPNLLTLSVVLGSGSAAHAGQRIMDVDAPAFRGGSLVGAIAGLVVAAFTIYALFQRRRRGRELKTLRQRDRERRAVEKAEEKSERKSAEKDVPPATRT